MDVRRVRPAQDANEVAAEQIEALLGRLEEGEAVVPLFVFDAGYDPVKVQRALEGSPCQILVRLRAGGASTAILASATRQNTSDALVATDRR